VELHISDTIRAGCGLNDLEMVRLMVEGSFAALSFLERLGVRFDRDERGKYHLTREGGHSVNRILHWRDTVGKELVKKMVRHLATLEGVKMVEAEVYALTLSDGEVCGVRAVSSDGEDLSFRGRVILAAGGGGAVYRVSSYSRGSLGLAQAMALEAGASLTDMEFVQFHPTLVRVGEGYELLTESLRGEGAVLVNDEGERFMFRYDERGELAPRDVVVYGEWRELRRGKRLFLSLEPIGRGRLRERFPGVSRLVEEHFGGELLLPVFPGAHYFIGGISTDSFGRTGVPNLYACGECAGTRVHGANRLASNSLLECVVFGMRCGRAVGERRLGREGKSEPPRGDYYADFDRTLSAVRSVMEEKVGAVRRVEELRLAAEELRNLTPEGLRGRRVVDFALSVVLSALARRGSVGDHLVEEGGRLVYEENPRYHTVVRIVEGELTCTVSDEGRCEGDEVLS
jgi:L-aspartate oxidase